PLVGEGGRRPDERGGDRMRARHRPTYPPTSPPVLHSKPPSATRGRDERLAAGGWASGEGSRAPLVRSPGPGNGGHRSRPVAGPRHGPAARLQKAPRNFVSWSQQDPICVGGP